MDNSNQTPQEKIAEIEGLVAGVKRTCTEINDQLDALRNNLAAREQEDSLPLNHYDEDECDGLLPQ